MEGCLSHQSWPVRTHCHVFRSMQCAGYLPGLHEQHLQGADSSRCGSNLCYNTSLSSSHLSISCPVVHLYMYHTPSLGLTPHSLGLDTAPHLLLLSDSTRSRTTFLLTHSLTHSASLHLLFSSIPCTIYKSMYCRLSPKLELFNITP